MPFIFHIPNSFLIVDYKPRQGIFYQNYTSEGFLKPFQIYPSTSNNYSATINSKAELYVLVENNKDQILFIDVNANTRKVVLDDQKHLYNFKDLAIHPLGDLLYMFYTVKHPSSTARSLMCQSLTNGTPNIGMLISYLPEDSILITSHTEDCIYILHTNFEEGYSLLLTKLTSAGVETETLLQSPIPITDCNLCLIDDIAHVVYIKDLYGQHQLAYINTATRTEVLLDTSPTATAPCIFKYSNKLWITYMDNNHLYVLLSIANGSFFSIPVRASLGEPISRYHYMDYNMQTLHATFMHANLFNSVRLAVVSAIDITGIHPDLAPLTELDLILESTRIHTHDTPPKKTKPSPNITPPVPPAYSPATSAYLPTPPGPTTLSPQSNRTQSAPTPQTPPLSAPTLAPFQASAASSRNTITPPITPPKPMPTPLLTPTPTPLPTSPHLKAATRAFMNDYSQFGDN